MCLILPNQKRAASVYADTLVNCYALERYDFDRILALHPAQKTYIEKIAKRRLRDNRVADQLRKMEIEHQFTGGMSQSFY